MTLPRPLASLAAPAQAIRRGATLACALLLFFAMPGKPALAGELAAVRTIQLPLTVDSVQSRQVRFALELAYESLGIKVLFTPRPALRAMIEADGGQLDGEVIRPTTIEATYANLRRVDVPLYMNVASAWVRKDAGPAPTKLQAVQQFKRVGIVRGIQHAEESTKGWPNLVVANSYASGVRMLQMKVVDVLLGGDGPIKEAIDTAKLGDQFAGNDIYAVPLYHYLHKRHADLLPLVQKELNKLKGQQATVLDGVLASGREGIPR